MKGIKGVVGKEVSCCKSSSGVIGTWRESTIFSRSRLINSPVTTPVRFRSVTSRILEFIIYTVWLVDNVGDYTIGKEKRIRRQTPKADRSEAKETERTIEAKGTSRLTGFAEGAAAAGRVK